MAKQIGGVAVYKEVQWSSGQPSRVLISAQGLPMQCGLKGDTLHCNTVQKMYYNPRPRKAAKKEEEKKICTYWSGRYGKTNR